MTKTVCYKCKQPKADYKFSTQQQLSETPKCKTCESEDRTYMDAKSNSPRIKRRKCINCGEEFDSYNDYRYCRTCKARWKTNYAA